MKRIAICLTIIAIILAVGIYALASIDGSNDRLYGHIEAVLAEYESGGDPRSEIEDLKAFFEKKYVRALGCFVNDDRLGELSVSISRLVPMLESDCDEFTAECEAIREEARQIYIRELPEIFRIF